MDIFAYASAVFAGIVLGLLGGGGSILTVPILVYLLEVPAYQATGYSLFIVGVSSLIGAVGYMKKGEIDMKTAVLFSIPSFIGVLISRKFVLPILPETLFSISSFVVTKNAVIMLLFAVLMILASVSMIRTNKGSENAKKQSAIYLIMKFFLVGVFLGLVGAGGGFLIIPALIFFAQLEMKTAVGTSLVIIAANSLIGFAGDLTTSLEIDWSLLLLFSLLSVAGIIIGGQISGYIDGKKLKPVFGWFVLTMAVVILLQELVLR